MKKYIYITAALITTMMASCGNSEKQNQDKNDDTLPPRDTSVIIENTLGKNVAPNDLLFFKNTANNGATEIEASARMLIVSTDSAVKRFAKMMIVQHQKLNIDLSALAKKKGIDLPQVLPDDKLEMVRKIDTYRHDGRNEYYAHMMVDEHVKTIDLFNAAVLSKDKDISVFAKQKLQDLDNHLKMAKALESNLTAHMKNQGDDPLKLSDKKQLKP